MGLPSRAHLAAQAQWGDHLEDLHFSTTDCFWSVWKLQHGLCDSHQPFFALAHQLDYCKYGRCGSTDPGHLSCHVHGERLLSELPVGMRGLQAGGLFGGGLSHHSRAQSLGSQLRSSHGHRAANGDAPHHKGRPDSGGLHLGLGYPIGITIGFLSLLQGASVEELYGAILQGEHLCAAQVLVCSDHHSGVAAIRHHAYLLHSHIL